MVGGAVRDMLLGRRPGDLDLATAAPPEVVEATFDRTLRVGAAFGVIAVVIRGHPYQVATFRREGPYVDGRRPSFVERADLASDAMRRDFTVNALFYDPVGGVVHDFVGGRADLRRQCIRTVGDPAVRFKEDRLRMLRAVRLAAELQFRIAPETFRAVAGLAHKIRGVSAERVRDELVRLLAAPGRELGVRLLADCGLLSAVLPEVAALGAREGGAEDLLAHSRRVLGRLRRPSSNLAAAALLHHAGGPRAAEAACQRLRFAARDRRAVVALLRDFAEFRAAGRLGVRTMRRVLDGGRVRPLLELYRAHSLECGEGLHGYTGAIRAFAALARSLGGRRRVLSGDDLIALGHRPGPALGRILEAVEEARNRGEIGSTDDARRWVAARFPAGSPARAVEPAIDTGGNNGRRAPGGTDVRT